jgi:shikimate kinase
VNTEPANLDNVFLIGYRCTGKSSVGRQLSARLGWSFIDTDAALVSDSGRSIREIVETDGWETFRKLEHEVVKQVCDKTRQVVATGGGVVLSAANVERMRASGKIVWLRATAETIRKRMMRDTDTDTFRPALTSRDSVSEIEETLFERETVYRRVMDFYVHTDSLSLDAIVDSISKALKD